SMTRFRANNVEISGNIAANLLHRDSIADSLQLITRAVRKIGRSESDDFANSADSAATRVHTAPIVTPSPGDMTKVSISRIRAKTSAFCLFDITDGLRNCRLAKLAPSP